MGITKETIEDLKMYDEEGNLLAVMLKDAEVEHDEPDEVEIVRSISRDRTLKSLNF